MEDNEIFSVQIFYRPNKKTSHIVVYIITEDVVITNDGCLDFKHKEFIRSYGKNIIPFPYNSNENLSDILEKNFILEAIQEDKINESYLYLLSSQNNLFRIDDKRKILILSYTQNN